jgi:hypothetical protein
LRSGIQVFCHAVHKAGGVHLKAGLLPSQVESWLCGTLLTQIVVVGFQTHLLGRLGLQDFRDQMSTVKRLQLMKFSR